MVAKKKVAKKVVKKKVVEPKIIFNSPIGIEIKQEVLGVKCLRCESFMVLIKPKEYHCNNCNANLCK